MTDTMNTEISCLFPFLDVTCLNVFNGRDDCTVANWAITRIILWAVSLSCCIPIGCGIGNSHTGSGWDLMRKGKDSIFISF